MLHREPPSIFSGLVYPIVWRPETLASTELPISPANCNFLDLKTMGKVKAQTNPKRANGSPSKILCGFRLGTPITCFASPQKLQTIPLTPRPSTLNYLVLRREWGNGLWDYYWGLYRDYYRDPFPHSLLSTRE